MKELEHFVIVIPWLSGEGIWSRYSEGSDIIRPVNLSDSDSRNWKISGHNAEVVKYLDSDKLPVGCNYNNKQDNILFYKITRNVFYWIVGSTFKYISKPLNIYSRIKWGLKLSITLNIEMILPRIIA